MAVTKVSSTLSFIARSPATSGETATGRWTPNTDLYVTDAGLVVKIELAGMKSDSLEISVEGQRLRINGERQDGCRAAQCSFLIMEISYGPFEALLDLPPGYDLGAAKAIYVNGFLRIDVPPLPAAHHKSSKGSGTAKI
jgi:HSP20 family protein